MRILQLFVLLLMATVCASARGAETSFLFATLLEEKKILTFERDLQSGELTRLAETDCPAEPACMAVSRDRRYLLVSYRSSGELASFKISWADGRLTPVNSVEAGKDPAYLLPDRSGRFVLAAFYQSNQVTLHGLAANGELSRALQVLPTAPRAHGLALDQSNRFLFVPHTGANRIYQFEFDSAAGQLSPVDPPFVTAPSGDEPRHMMLHPNDRFAYTSNEKGDSLGVYRVDRKLGTLSHMQTLPTIPAEFDGAKNSTARCEMTPDGRFVYVANRGHDSIAGFAIDSKTGKATALGTTKTEQTPRSFSIDSTGRFLYAAGQASGKIAAFRINKRGQLQRFATYPSGPVSWWVLVVDSP